MRFRQVFFRVFLIAPLTDILEYLDRLLEPGRFRDYGPNGLQVPGAAEVGTVVTGVSAHRELFERAIEAGAQLIVVHHGLFWEGAPLALSPPMAARLKLLLEADIGLAAYHLPLDSHPHVGNNALIAQKLGCQTSEPFAELRGVPIGVAGRFAGDGLAADELFGRVREVTDRAPLVFAHGPARVRSIGIVSGGAPDQVEDAIAAGLDAFLTGEPAERVMATAQEGAIHFIAAGHYATETFGVRRLGELLADEFGVEHRFVDVPNPV